jgi:putative nucleotidyltransferase with HDIG domain
LPPETPVYLVGGAVRDAMLGIPTHDLDFAVPARAGQIARQVADGLSGAFYPLDEERDYGRVILTGGEGERQVIDFAQFQGPDLESDLRNRDFSVNAMAVDIRSEFTLVDPLGGAADLRRKRLRACSPRSFITDPLRILRGIRLAASFGFQVVPETRQLMRQAAPGLPGVSRERLRDEIFRILDAPRQAASLQALDLLGVMPYLFPELLELKGVEQSPPHVSEVWNHTFEVLKKLDSVLQVLSPVFNPDLAANLHLGLLVLRLGRYREALETHLGVRLNQDRSLRPLLFLAALYHDIGKPQTRTSDAQGRIRFLGHEETGAKQTARRLQFLQLSNAEIDRAKTIVRHHMRPLLLAQTGDLPSRRAIYRFFRDTGPAGIDIGLLSLADVLGTYGPTLPQETWANHLEVVRTLFEAWWERPAESVSPPALVTGHDLIAELQVSPGPLVGKMLAAIQEAQATGQVKNRRQALSLAKDLLANSGRMGTKEKGGEIPDASQG